MPVAVGFADKVNDVLRRREVQPHDLQIDVRAWSDEEWEEALLPAIVALSFRLLKYKCNMKQRFPPRHWRPALTDDLQLHFDDRVQSAFWGGRSGATNTIRCAPALVRPWCVFVQYVLVPRFSQSVECFVHFEREPAKSTFGVGGSETAPNAPPTRPLSSVSRSSCTLQAKERVTLSPKLGTGLGRQKKN